jgi:hypothetical protein
MHPVTSPLGRSFIKVKRHKGEEGVYPQRVSDAKQDLGFSYKKGRPSKPLPKYIKTTQVVGKAKKIASY